ncbi:MAG: DUF3105 domain-containing protein [Candidatus Bipolaricaulota bacterium]|nr:DUF3105 domain-containing protein [Candidatus Bipolaricaulota bacterium]
MSKKEQRQAKPKRYPRRLWLWGIVGMGALGLIVLVVVFQQSSQSFPETQPLPKRGDPDLLRNVQSFPSEGTEHVPESTQLTYHTEPPTSGRHYGRETPAGFYVEPRAAGNLVHSLEHGAVVIYYDPAKLTDEIRQSLTRFVQAHRDPWASVVVVPHPNPKPGTPFVLTAWTKMLVLDRYDVPTIRAFLAEYLGRGPESPVR